MQAGPSSNAAACTPSQEHNTSEGKASSRPRGSSPSSRSGYNPDYYKDRDDWKSDDIRLLVMGAVVLLMSMLFSLSCAVCFFSIGRRDFPWPPDLESAVPMPMYMDVQEVNASGASTTISSLAPEQLRDSSRGAEPAVALAVGAVDNEWATVMFDDRPDWVREEADSARLPATDSLGGADRKARYGGEGAGLLDGGKSGLEMKRSAPRGERRGELLEKPGSGLAKEW